MAQDKDALDFEEKVDPVYKKGFEHGYWLERGNYEGMRDLMQRSAKHEGYYSGLQAGQKEAVREKVRERFNQMDKQKEQDKDKGMDIG